MKLAKPLVIVATAALFVTSVASAGAATRQQDRQHLRDATCTAQTCIPVGDAVKAQNGQKADKAAGQNGAQNGTKARKKDGTCTTVAAAQLRTGAKDQTRLHLQDGSCLSA